MSPKQLHNPGGQGNRAALLVFGGYKQVPGVFLFFSLELLVDQDCTLVEIHTIPGKPKRLPFPHTGK